jgi:hypothetical protein
MFDVASSPESFARVLDPRGQLLLATVGTVLVVRVPAFG